MLSISHLCRIKPKWSPCRTWCFRDPKSKIESNKIRSLQASCLIIRTLSTKNSWSPQPSTILECIPKISWSPQIQLGLFSLWTALPFLNISREKTCSIKIILVSTKCLNILLSATTNPRVRKVDSTRKNQGRKRRLQNSIWPATQTCMNRKLEISSHPNSRSKCSKIRQFSIWKQMRL